MSGIKKVIRAEVMGFCMGVRSVMEKVDTEAGVHENSEDELFTYGPLIHNPQVIKRLESRGVVAIDSPDQAPGGTVVVRAHGIHPAKREEFEKSGFRIVEGTCPRVLHSQKIVASHSEMGWFIVLVGDKGHGEVKAVAGCADDCAVILSEKEAETLEIPDKTLVIAQTTLSKGEYESICRVLESRNPNIKIIKSICPATRDRQAALLELAAKVEAVVVVGGRNSANTRRLYLSAVNEGLPAWHVEDVDDLPPEIYKFDVVGISAGASTPDWMIDRIEERLLSGE